MSANVAIQLVKKPRTYADKFYFTVKAMKKKAIIIDSTKQSIYYINVKTNRHSINHLFGYGFIDVQSGIDWDCDRLHFNANMQYQSTKNNVGFKIYDNTFVGDGIIMSSNSKNDYASVEKTIEEIEPLVIWLTQDEIKKYTDSAVENLIKAAMQSAKGIYDVPFNPHNRTNEVLYWCIRKLIQNNIKFDKETIFKALEYDLKLEKDYLISNISSVLEKPNFLPQISKSISEKYNFISILKDNRPL